MSSLKHNAADEIIAELQSDIQKIKLKNAQLLSEVYEKQREISLLKVELAEQQRFKRIIKNFLRKIDAIIEELLLPKSKRIAKQPDNVEVVYEAKLKNSADKQLEEIREYDTQNLTRLHPERHFVRQPLLRGYRSIRDLIKPLAIFTLKVLKKAKHLISRATKRTKTHA